MLKQSMGIQEIGGYRFERISETEYRVTSPDGTSCVKYYTAAEGLMKKLQRQANPTEPVSEVYTPATPAWHKLQAYAALINSFQDNIMCKVDTCYKDAGAGVVWTTVLARRKDGQIYQLLTPHEQKELLNMSYTDFTKTVSAKLSSIKHS